MRYMNPHRKHTSVLDAGETHIAARVNLLFSITSSRMKASSYVPHLQTGVIS